VRLGEDDARRDGEDEFEMSYYVRIDNEKKCK
jgi:hypothetical protein